jgi:hypothetical protein
VTGAGCFNSISRNIVAERAEVAIICCCTSIATRPNKTHAHNNDDYVRGFAGSPQMMAPGGDFPEGMMNIHDATFVDYSS